MKINKGISNQNNLLQQKAVDSKALKPKKSPLEEKVMNASKLYEKVFINEMVKAMRSSVSKSDLVKESMGEKIYKDQMYDQYVDEWSKVGGVGLSNIIYDQIMEKFQNTMPMNQIQKPKGPLPLEDSKFFKIEEKNPQKGAATYNISPESKEPMALTTPWKALVTGQSKVGESNVLFLDHQNGLKSTMVYKGHMAPLDKGIILDEGTKLGVLSPGGPGMMWKIEPLHSEVLKEGGPWS